MSILIDGADMITKIHKELCPDINCVDCSMCTEDGSCRVEDWIDKFPSPKTKQVKYYDEDEAVWKIGEVIVDEAD